MKRGKESALISVQQGDRIKYEDGRIVTLVGHNIMPNGINDPNLVLVLIGRTESGNKISATSDKFSVIEDEFYEECYPSVEVSKDDKPKSCEKCGKENVTIAPYPTYTFFGLIKTGVKHVCMVCFLEKNT